MELIDAIILGIIQGLTEFLPISSTAHLKGVPLLLGWDDPGIELTAVTACIPIVNVVLATKELIAGTLDYGLLGLSFAIMMLIAIVAVVISYKRFDKETNVVL